MSAEDQSLLERIELPAIPADARTKISHLMEELDRAEVEQCKFIPLLSLYTLWRLLQCEGRGS